MTDWIFAPHMTDFYKTGHVGMIPGGTSMIYSNMTARSDKLGSKLEDFDHKILLVGIQRALHDIHQMWDKTFFSQPKNVVVAKLKRRLSNSLPSNARVDEICEHFADLHDVGHLPVVIKSLDEGSRVPMRVPFMTITNTNPDFAFVTNYLETVLSNEIWKTVVNSTTSFEYLRFLTASAIETTGDASGVPFQGHDFSARGMSGSLDASTSGIGHLSCFKGTDTVSAIDVVEEYYVKEEDKDNVLIGTSVPATEHMVMCLGGQETEIDTFRRLIVDEYPTGIISIVSDTWDFFQVVTKFVTELKDEILARKPDSSGMAKLTLRPDSGDPVKIICGDPDAPVGSPEYKGAVECLWDVFGGTESPQGYKILDPHVGVIYGDSITLERMVAIVNGLKAKGFASTNVVFGIGSYTYQHVTRDSYSIAGKATYGIVNGQSLNLLKSPKTDDGTKKSATGLLRIEQENGEYVLYENQTPEQEKGGCLKVRYEDGLFYNQTDWTELTARVQNELEKRLHPEKNRKLPEIVI